MKIINGKLKLILVIAGFLILTILMFTLGYKIMGKRNQALSDQLSESRLELEVLQREQKNFEQGKKDLAALEKATYPPADLFSKDTKLVKEIQQLETVANLYNLDLKIAISGTVKTAVKVPTAAWQIYAIPYTMTLEGTFPNTMLFMQAVEHLPFITPAKIVSVDVGTVDGSRTTVSSEFYIQK